MKNILRYSEYGRLKFGAALKLGSRHWVLLPVPAFLPSLF
jgi:hypothetical protein